MNFILVYVSEYELKSFAGHLKGKVNFFNKIFNEAKFTIDSYFEYFVFKDYEFKIEFM